MRDRRRLDPDQLAIEQRIDEAALDVELLWEARTEAEMAVANAEVLAAAEIERLIVERLAVKDVVQLTGLDQATVRRLRQLKTKSSGGDLEIGPGQEGVMTTEHRDAKQPRCVSTASSWSPLAAN